MMSSETAPSDSPDESFRPALLVVDMQEDFCPPVSTFTPLGITPTCVKPDPDTLQAVLRYRHPWRDLFFVVVGG